MSSHGEEEVLNAANLGVSIGVDDGDDFIKVSKLALNTCASELAQHVADGESAALCVAVQVQVGGKINPGAILLLDDRAILAWTEGTFRVKTRTQVLFLANIESVTTALKRPNRLEQTVATVCTTAGHEHEILFWPVMKPRLGTLVCGFLDGTLKPVWAEEL